MTQAHDEQKTPGPMATDKTAAPASKDAPMDSKTMNETPKK